MLERKTYVICACMAVLVVAVGMSPPQDPEPTFMIEPTSVNASQSNEAVEFTCSCIYCTSQFWTVNDLWALNDVYQGRGIHVDDRKTQSDGSFFYRLTVPPLEVNNNINISCIIHNTTSNVVKESQIAVLRVQGLLAKVESLMVTNINSTTLLMSYKEPMSLLGVPILFYRIVVITVDTMDIISTTNTTNTSVYINLDKAYVCSKLELRVSGWNEVGGGQIANISAVLYDVPAALNASMLATDLQYHESELEVYLQIVIDDSCAGRTPDLVMLNISSIESNQLITTELCSLPKSAEESPTCSFVLSLSETINTCHYPLVRISLAQLLQTNHHYQMTVFLGNHGGTTPSTHYITFSTYDVQEGHVYISTVDSVCITCTILSGSPMNICTAIFTDTNTERRIEVVIPGPTFADCVELPSGTYSVEFRDVSISGDVEMGVAYHPQTTVQVKPTFPPPSTETAEVSMPVVATQNSQSSTGDPILPIAITGSGVVIGLLVIVMVILVILLHHFKRKAGKLVEEKQGGEKVHFTNSIHHSDVAVGEFGNIASEPQHLYDNVNELNAGRKPNTVLMGSNSPTPPSTIRVQPCPAYAEFPQNLRSVPTRPAVQTDQDIFTDV